MNRKILVVAFMLSIMLASGVVYAQAVITEVLDQTVVEADKNRELAVLGERTLRIGDTGDDVAELQSILNELGFREGSIDGKFGPLTYGSVLRFQKDQKLGVSGRVEGETMDRLLDFRPAPAEEIAEEFAIMSVPVSEFNFTEDEMSLFARIVHAESAGEPYEGQVAVAATILNRIRSEKYPDTMRGVVYQIESGRYQYSPVLDGRINLPAGESAKRAVQEALKGNDPTGGATGFFNPAKTYNAWVRSKPVTTVIGRHVFFMY